MKLPKNMDIKKIVFLIIICFHFGSCFQFNGEKIEINYRDKTIRVLSDDYIIESVMMKNNQTKYYVLELKDTIKGSQIINFKDKPSGYNIVVDSLDHYCSLTPDVDSPGLWVTIIKKGLKSKTKRDKFKEIQYFNYNKLPCGSTLIDTISASNPYK
ncbi:hypothetical protein [Flavobacterium sp. N1736]|uniref:hypothetical protein n=1 Tax=Flavobacterium sp. N1736 TaxID=2986823 RepID=UPI002224BBA5|nr:hypothetical protein [Flavobacterium sp. N1736]